MKLTEEQKELEKLLLEHIKQETKAVKERTEIPETALALVELWKVATH